MDDKFDAWLDELRKDVIEDAKASLRAIARARIGREEAVSGDAVEAALDEWDGGSGWRRTPFADEWRNGMRAAITAADRARGRTYVEWHDIDDNTPRGRTILVGQRGATESHKTILREDGTWAFLPPGYAKPDCWTEIPGPPMRTVRPFDPIHSPGHTDLMVSPESMDAFMEANPLPDEATGEARKAPVDAPTPEQFEELCRALCAARGLNHDAWDGDSGRKLWESPITQQTVRDWLAMSAKARELGL